MLLNANFVRKFFSANVHFTVVFSIFLVITEDEFKVFGLHEKFRCRFNDQELADKPKGFAGKLFLLRQFDVFVEQGIVEPLLDGFHLVNNGEIADDHTP